MNRIFEDDEEVAVMEPLLGTKIGNPLYISGAVVPKVPPISDRSAKELLSGILPQPKKGKEVSLGAKAERYVNMSALVEELREREGLDLFDTAERVNSWIVEALNENRRITVSFKDAEASHGVMGEVIGDLYDRYPEELIESNVKLVDIEWYWQGALESVVKHAKLHRDDPAAYEKLMYDLDRIAMGDY
jgi:hypothetical protein